MYTLLHNMPTNVELELVRWGKREGFENTSSSNVMNRLLATSRSLIALAVWLTLVYCRVCPGQVNILTANGSANRTNASLHETQLTPATVTPATFGKIDSLQVDGEVYAQVLYLSALAIPGRGVHDVVIVCTMHNSVYAFDASATPTEGLLWRVNLGPSVHTWLDIDGEIGILSTGAIDPQRGVLYVVSETLRDDGPTFYLHALDVTSGAERLNGPVAITATVTGSTAGEQLTPGISLDVNRHLQRPGLLLANGSVYIGFGSHADEGSWHGWILRYDASDLRHQMGVFTTTPAGAGGAIWQSGRGLAADETGNIYAVTGNGDYDGAQNFGESVLKLGGSLGSPSDWFTPSTWQDLSDNDLDLSAGPALVSGTHTLIAGDKAGNLYVVDGDSMGHLTSEGSYPLNMGEIFNLAVWALPDGAYVYVQPHDGPLLCYAITGSSLDSNPVSSGPASNGSGRTGMTISAAGGNLATGILWTISDSTVDPSGAGTLHAFNASNLAVELWNSDMNPTLDALGAFPKFVSPTVANGRVYAPTFSNAVEVYGLTSAASAAQRKGHHCRQAPMAGGGRLCLGIQ